MHLAPLLVIHRGFFPPSNLFDASVSRGTSSSSMEPSPKVFSLPQLVAEEDSDVASLVGNSKHLSEGLARVCRLLFHLYPGAVPSSVVSALHSCVFDAMSSDIAKLLKEPFSPVLFHRVSELLSEACSKFTSAANAGKTPVSALPFKKCPLAASSDPEFGRALL